MGAMVAPARPKARPKDTRPVRASTPAPESSSRPFLRFHHSAALRKKTVSVLDALEKAPDASTHREALADLVVELTNSGLDAYFMQPLKSAKAGYIVEQTASLGLAGAMQVMGSVIRNIIGRMNAAQVLSVSGSIRQFMR